MNYNLYIQRGGAVLNIGLCQIHGGSVYSTSLNTSSNELNYVSFVTCNILADESVSGNCDIMENTSRVLGQCCYPSGSSNGLLVRYKKHTKAHSYRKPPAP